ncbi:MAG: Na+/H+ antiporter NhaC family protein [Cardiobacteriaceae bacterium]|nr:Na+/H+ antiporter NhaC family protein [Cardiobacteriaceae bacterium]
MNPVILAVCLMLALSLARVHVVFSLIISAFIGGIVAEIPQETILTVLKPDEATIASTPAFLLKMKYLVKVFEEGIAAGTSTALSYAVLGAFAVAISYSGLSQVMANMIIGQAKQSEGVRLKWLLITALLIMSMMSQNLVPIHIAFIPLIVPPLLIVMNHLKVDRRLLACVITFGLVCTYMFIPYGFGDIFLNKILLGNITKFGMDVSNVNIYYAMAIPALGMLAGLGLAMFYSYRKPRDYQDLPVEGAAEQVPIQRKNIIVALIAVIVAFLVQKYTGSLILAGLLGFAIFMMARVIHWQQADTVFNSGIRMMSMIAFIMIAANGFAAVMNATGGIEPLVKESVALFGNSKVLVSLAMLVVGLLVTMGIGSSFSTLPIIAAIYVPICAHMGFSPLATVSIIGTAGALGDAGSPASDSTLGPTMGFNADGQHNHMKDTVIPTFIHYNIPLLIAGWIAAMVL